MNFEIQKAVIIRDDKYLIVLRSPTAKFFPKHRDFPGGKLEPGENPQEGVAREVFEETGLRVRVEGIVGNYEMNLVPEYKHQFTVYETLDVQGDVKLSLEHTAFKWATKEELLELPIEPYMKMYFEEHP